MTRLHISNGYALWLRERDHYVTVALAAASVLVESMLAASRQESIKRETTFLYSK